MTLTYPIRIPQRAVAFAALLLTASLSAAAAQDVPKGEIVAIKIKLHDEEHWVQIRLDEASAPRHCANFKILAEGNFYAGMAFHRVIRDYLVQTGDPLTKDQAEARNWGTGGVGYDLAPEIGLPHKRGAVGMARLRSSNPNKRSGGSQFYIMLTNAPELDKDYTVFGEVVDGLDVLGRMSRARVDTNDAPVNRIEIVETRLGEPGFLNAITDPITAIPKVAIPKVSLPKVSNPLAGIRNPFAKKEALSADEEETLDDFKKARAGFLEKEAPQKKQAGAAPAAKPKAEPKPAPKPKPAPIAEREIDLNSEPPLPEEKPARKGFFSRFGKSKSKDKKAPSPPKEEVAPEEEKPRGPIGRIVNKIW